MSYKDKLVKDKLPKHVAIIMDGNGRWAKQQGKMRVFGHQAGVKSVREAVEAAAEAGIQYLTLYAFSTENWSRTSFEVNALMELLIKSLINEFKTLMQNDIKLLTIGNTQDLPESARKKLLETIQQTANNKRLTLVLALSYSSKWEITEAIKKIAAQAKEGIIKIGDINSSTIDSYLTTAGIPDPELMIRTSGEYRISNFMLWQLAYAELYFTKKFWPEFSKEDFFEAVVDFQNRERRFGGAQEE
ncbi:MAG: isoprenyl transferase [Bacteroidetes bacterium]|nr:isoprenyl transferase [Bacteroidota bacterium]